MQKAPAADITIEGAFLAKEGVVTPANEGVTCADCEATMKYMGNFA